MLSWRWIDVWRERDRRLICTALHMYALHMYEGGRRKLGKEGRSQEGRKEARKEEEKNMYSYRTNFFFPRRRGKGEGMV